MCQELTVIKSTVSGFITVKIKSFLPVYNTF